MTMTPRTWLTREAFERLSQELEHLLGTNAADEDMDTTVSADFDQEPVVNADRRAARIQQIEQILNHAVVGETPPDDGVAEPGMVLTVRFDDTDDTSTFLLGVREATDQDQLEVYSPNSPLGAALCGTREASSVPTPSPAGRPYA